MTIRYWKGTLIMKIVGIIPARYKSSRFPGKPLALICGKPMIWWVYQQCTKVEELDEIAVATDDSRIFDSCVELGIKAVMTHDNIPTGSDRVAEAAKSIDGDLYINIQGDEPVIEPEMIRQTIKLFDDKSVYFGTLKKAITDIDLINSVNTVKVVTDCNDNALYFSRSVIPSNIKDGRIADVFRHVGIYAYTKEFLQKFHEMEQTDLELGEAIEPLRALQNGYKIRVGETQYDSIGVDVPEHIHEVEKIIKER